MQSDTYAYDFWASVMRGPAGRFEHRPFRLQGRHPEIRNADVVLFVQQQIFRLQISMAEKQRMTVKRRA